MKKTCSKCREEKQLTDFHKNKSEKYGVHHYCKSCNSNHKKSTYDYTSSKKMRLRSVYNLTIEEVESLFISQNKKCKICGVEHPTVSKHGGLYIDHCHINGVVRWLLCTKCNTVLGLVNDDVSILRAAIDYLNK